jgi:hypothetical protein
LDGADSRVSAACSTLRGGIGRPSSSSVEERMFVSFFSLVALTSPFARRWPRRRRESAQNSDVASYSVNDRAVERARRLIRGRQYVLDSDWGDVLPTAEDENTFLSSHSWSEYGEWHLGLTEGPAEETKARYAFVFGDFRRLHRTGLIACHYRAAEWRHKEIELAAHELLQLLDKSSA